MSRIPVISVVPMKPLSSAKSRLAPYLEDVDRRRLALNMLRRVIKAAGAASGEVWVLGSDPLVEEMAVAEGAKWCWERGSNVNESLRLSFEEVWSNGAAALFLPGDLPALRGEDVLGLAQLARTSQSAALVPARGSGGTNAMLLAGASGFQPLLGPDSFRKHLAQAEELGLHPAIYFSPGLSLDLDTWDDVEVCEAMAPGLFKRLLKEVTPTWLQKV